MLCQFHRANPRRRVLQSMALSADFVRFPETTWDYCKE